MSRKNRKHTGKKGNMKNLTRKVDKLIKAMEIKELNLFDSLTGNPSGDINFPLNAMGKGTNNGQRIADKIVMKSLEMNIRLVITQSEFLPTDSTQPVWTFPYLQSNVRIIIFIDRQNNGSTSTTVSQILQNVALQSDKMVSTYDYKFVDSPGERVRYKILYDRVHYLNAFSGAQQKNIRIHRRLGQVVRYNGGSTGTSSDIITNDLKILFLHNDGNMSVAFSTVLRYIDA